MIHANILGRVVADPILNSDRGVANFTVASQCARLVNNERKSEFVRCAVWGKRADTVAAHIHKGDVLVVSGELTTSEYVGRDGEKRVEIQIPFADFEFVPRPRAVAEGAQAPAQTAQPASAEDDDLPF